MALCRSSSNVLAQGPCSCANKSKSMLSRRQFVCRAHFKLGNLNPGETADLWLDINVPKKSEEKGRERRRDKVLGFFMGAKGKQEREVEDCRVHIQACLQPSLALSILVLAPMVPKPSWSCLPLAVAALAFGLMLYQTPLSWSCLPLAVAHSYGLMLLCSVSPKRYKA